MIFLPNIIWQFQNNFATLGTFAKRPKVGQKCRDVAVAVFRFANYGFACRLSLPVWLAGIWFFLADKNGRRFRFLGICYLVLLALMIYLKAKDYYLVPVYPMLFAGGAVFWEQLIEKVRSLRFAKIRFADFNFRSDDFRRAARVADFAD